MEQQRNILFILFLVLSLFLYWSWEADKNISVQQQELEKVRAEQIEAQIAQDNAIGQIIKLSSDTLDLAINLNGGDIVDGKLPLVKQEQGKDDPFHLLMNQPQFVYVAQSGLIGDGPDSKSRPLYKTDAKSYTLKDREDTVSAVLTYTQDNVTYTKTYTLTRGSYVVDVSYHVDNKSEKDLKIAFYGQLKQTVDATQESTGAFTSMAGAYRGTAYSTQDVRYEKNKLEDLVDLNQDRANLNVPTKAGWIAMIQHYFVSAWIGQENQNNVIYSSASKDGRDAILGIRSEAVTVKAGQTTDFNNRMWIGPKNQDAMEKVAPNLDLTVDYGWLWFLSIPLFKILEFIHSFIGNWGFSIIILTLIVRGVLFPLTKAQYTSMAKMRLLTPKMQELRERYKDDKQKLGQETMRLYKTEKVNPLGGCLPILIQMPIFIALYWTLMESTELRHAPFIFWITDLSVYDPYFVTPILYGITMFLIQKMSPTPINDPVQRKVIMAMPLVFTFMFCTFPAGLTVYWLVSNCFTIFQQIIIFKSLEKRGLHVKVEKK